MPRPMAPATWNDLVMEQWADSARPAIVDDDGIVTGQELLALAAEAGGEGRSAAQGRQGG